MQRICVFAGSRPGKRDQYRQTAETLGQELASRGLTLVYGGGGVGLMGAVANATLDAGGQVIGVMPRDLFSSEVAHRQLTELHEVGTMHERKRMMYDLADGFIALPGGFGTFDELIEIITWAQIGIHHKPIVLLNIGDYFAPLLALIDHAIAEGFIEERYRNLIILATEPAEAVDLLLATLATNGATSATTSATNVTSAADALAAPSGSLNGHSANGHVGVNGYSRNGATGVRQRGRGSRGERAARDKSGAVEAPPAP